MRSKTKFFLVCGGIFILAIFPLAKKYGMRGLDRLYGTVCRPDVMIQGPVLMADGIGRQTVELAQTLSRKHRVQILANYVNKKDVPSSVKDMLRMKYKKTAPVAIIEECLWFPGNPLERFFSTTDSSSQIRYAYSMFESTQIMPEWVMMLNLYFDAVIVPDPFLVDVYVNSGVTIPVFHIPLGIDIRDFLQAPLKTSKTKGPFVFASLGKAEDRKNHVMAIQAFAKVLGNNPNAILYVNCRAGEQEFKEELRREVLSLNCNNIKFTDVCLRKDAYLKFFSSVDCLVHLSKGEGFAIQPRESMALGIPVILTNNTAQTTICNSGLVKVVSSDIPQPACYGKRVVGEQFNCDIDECAAALLDVYFNYNKYLDKGSEMRDWAAQYDYKNISSQYQCIVSPKKVVLSDVNQITEDSIYTTSELLYNKYSRIFASSVESKNVRENTLAQCAMLNHILGENKEDAKKYVREFPFQQYREYSTKDRERYYCDEKNDVIKNYLKLGISWESHIRDRMLKYVKPGSVVLDIGAHIGTHTLSLAQAVGEQEGGRVIAFEPQPKIFRELFWNMQLNNVKNVEFYPVAVGDHLGQIELSPFAESNEGGTGLRGGTGQFVPLITIDSLKLDNVSLMKIDVEGLEDQVLIGLHDTILRCKPVIFIEIMGGCSIENATPEIKLKIENTIRSLENYGYVIERLGESDYLALYRS